VRECLALRRSQQASDISVQSPAAIGVSYGNIRRDDSILNDHIVESPHSQVQDSDYAASICTPSTSAPTTHLPPDAAARRFVDAYFRNVHRAYPFMDRNKTMQDLETITDMSQWHSTASSTLLYLVMAVGCTSLQRAGQVPEHTSSRFEIVYAEIIQKCLHHESTVSIQMLLLVALYSLFDPDGPSAWSVVGIASRQAVSIGLGLKDTGEQQLSPLNLEQRHRLFWVRSDGSARFSETAPTIVVACGALRPSDPDMIYERLLTLLLITSVVVIRARADDGNIAWPTGSAHLRLCSGLASVDSGRVRL
jgi:hypothetical protein